MEKIKKITEKIHVNVDILGYREKRKDDVLWQ